MTVATGLGVLLAHDLLDGALKRDGAQRLENVAEIPKCLDLIERPIAFVDDNPYFPAYAGRLDSRLQL
jgi:hypothetical protein